MTDRLYGIKPRIFVVRCTNTGKSFLLNKLIAKTTLNKEKEKKVIVQTKTIQIYFVQARKVKLIRS